MDRKMSPLELREHIIEFLKEHDSGSLATTLNGMPRCSPVQYVVGEEMDLYILSAGGDKFKAIEENPKACLLVNTEFLDPRKIKGIQAFGRAITSCEKPELHEEARKFCDGKDMNNISPINVIKVVPEEIVYLDSLEDGDRTKQILRHNQVILKQDDLH